MTLTWLTWQAPKEERPRPSIICHLNEFNLEFSFDFVQAKFWVLSLSSYTHFSPTPAVGLCNCFCFLFGLCLSLSLSPCLVSTFIPPTLFADCWNCCSICTHSRASSYIYIVEYIWGKVCLRWLICKLNSVFVLSWVTGEQKEILPPYANFGEFGYLHL